MKEIIEYHAHVYFDPVQEIEIARRLSKEINTRFQVSIGELKLKPIGPHKKPMFRVLFSKDQFSEFVQWLIFARGNLSVMIHPVTNNSYLDHVVYALWLGEKLEMDTSKMDYNQMRKTKRMLLSE